MIFSIIAFFSVVIAIVMVVCVVVGSRNDRKD